jgi:hypothetical protein
VNNLEEEKFIFAHGFRWFSQWLTPSARAEYKGDKTMRQSRFLISCQTGNIDREGNRYKG